MNQQISPDQQTDFNTRTTYKPRIHKGWWMCVQDACQWLQQNQRWGTALMIEGNYTPKHQDEYGTEYVSVATLLELLGRETVVQMQCHVSTLIVVQD